MNESIEKALEIAAKLEKKNSKILVEEEEEKMDSGNSSEPKEICEEKSPKSTHEIAP